MITLSGLYHIMTAVVPLYVAMMLAYGSVKWWKIFTPDQCSAINRFVALFAVPLLSFHFIATNDPYPMNPRFIAADTLQKLIVLAALILWNKVSKRGSLEWTITLFSLSNLPNTLVMGIPLLKGMYGEFSGGLMVQIVVLQCIIWYTLMLFMFEYRGAKILISKQFPHTAASIVSINVESDATSFDGRHILETDSQVQEDGKLHVTVRKSNASRSDIYSRKSMGFSCNTPRRHLLDNAQSTPESTPVQEITLILGTEISAMAAYASLLSLGHILDQLLEHPPRQRDVFDRAQIDSLLEIITFLRDFLEDYSLIRGDEMQGLEGKIAGSAYAAEDIMESRVVDQILEDSEAERSAYAAEDIMESRVVDQILEDSEAESESSSTLFCQDLQKVIEEFDCLKKDVMKLKESDQGIKITEQPKKYATVGSFIRGASDSKNTMVGFDEDLIQIMDTLTGDESNLQILSVVGMGGIGKTTLARHIFSNPLIVNHFDLHAWVTISQQYSVHEILLGLIKDTKVVQREGEQLTGLNEDELGLRLHKILFGRRYLIVMDDMWSIEVWNAIKRFFPDNDNGCRILVTTRLSNVADDFHSCTPHRLHLLDEVQSWSLFCGKVFGKSESCPLALEEIGKTIVRNCGGLPLAIAAISGLLAKSSRTVEYWESVANDTYEALNMGGDGFCFEILSLSYRHLPVHLSPCFLYMAIFREDSNIRVSMLVELWVAEGIVKPIRYRSLEAVAEDNLKDLIDRNLIQVRDYGSRNNIKSCSIHDLLRELCLKEAQKEKFLSVAMMHSLNRHPRSIGNMRRLIIQRTSDEEEFQQQVFDAMNLASRTRSLIFRESVYEPIKLPVHSRLLKVLSIYGICSLEEIPQLVNLRCIHARILFSGDENILESLSLSWNLQTVNCTGTLSLRPISLPTEIWEMPHLRHLKMGVGYFYLPDPPSTNSKNGRRDIFELKNLQTLYKMRDFRCTDEVLRRVPNLKKLGIAYELFSDGFGWDYYEIYNLAHLRNLESFTLESDEKLPQNLCFPRSLKKLTLECCEVSWGYLMVVGSLPHLEALNLRSYAVVGREWNPVEGQFLKLKSLTIADTDLEEWVADSSHFPHLEKLQLKWLYYLKEIPYGIGEIETLRSISLFWCSSSANASAEKIQEEQQQLGNTDLQVTVVR
ncbi:hypothetical protein F511_14755 [Dorcoceras hygrometricum]|uniref:Uncharacterized protein n=1 Tax=Dorcoceras hygrometricum TaxID=472368 RepID=A0A2Z7B048_9LAMI|nr:hypothetical protein F511_14755 [Dorcoceras hygrometricum]